MKRDLDLIRDILFAVEKDENNHSALAWQNLDLKDRKYDEIVFHINLLYEAGYLKLVGGADLKNGNDDENPVISRLTWTGYEFLEAARQDTNWNKAKEAAGKVGAFSLEVLKPVLVSLATKAALGLL